MPVLANLPKDWSNIVRGRRRALGMTQAQLAEAIGTSRQWVSIFETGRSASAARLGVLLDIVATLDLNVSLDGEGD